MLQFFKQDDVKRSLREITSATHLTVVVGAGASMEAGLTSWASLVSDLLKEAIDKRAWSDDERSIASVASRNGLLAAAEFASTLLGESDLGPTVKRLLYRGGEPATLYPGPLTKTIAGLQSACGRGHMAIGTFNYDELIERALRECDHPWWNDVRSYIQGRQAPPDSVGVVHLHGILGRTDRGRVV